MADSKGKRTAPNGFYWSNVWLENENKPKLVIAELIKEATEKTERRFCLWSNSSRIKNEKGWAESEDKEGWYFRIVFESEVNAFFDY